MVWHEGVLLNCESINTDCNIKQIAVEEDFLISIVSFLFLVICHIYLISKAAIRLLVVVYWGRSFNSAIPKLKDAAAQFEI